MLITEMSLLVLRGERMIYCVSECINVSQPKPILFFLFVQIYWRDVLAYLFAGVGVHA